MTMHKTLKTGSDLRTLSDYAALRDGLGKLAHPARPDVNWRYVENSVFPCLSTTVWSCRRQPGRLCLWV